jgi:5-methylcytosine-specific restriction endonuclease McrA
MKPDGNFWTTLGLLAGRWSSAMAVGDERMAERIDAQIKQLGADVTGYGKKLRDPRWQRRRLQVMDRDDWTCQMCGDRESTLNVHHMAYVDGVEPWDHPEHLLVTLCEGCHAGITRVNDRAKMLERRRN